MIMLSSRGYRQGFCDGLLGRDSTNPYSWDKPLAMQNYNKGYFVGKQRRIKDKITLKVEAI